MKDRYKTKAQLIGELDELRLKYNELDSLNKHQISSNENRKLFESTIETFNSPIFISDLKGNLTYINNSFMNLWGYDNNNEIIGLSFIKFCQTNQTINDIIRELSINGNWNGELIAKKKDGACFDVRLTVNIIEDQKGDPLCYQGSFIDITNQKKIEQALIKSEDYFKSIIENSQEVITIFQKDGIVIYDSPSIEQVLGYKQDKIIGKSIFEYIHPEDKGHFSKAFDDIIQNPEIHQNIEFRIRRKDGSWCSIEASGKSFESSPGIEEIIVNFRDITARNIAEESLKRSNESFNNIVDKSTDGIIVIDFNGVVRFVNPTAKHNFNRNVGEFVGDIFGIQIIVGNKNEIEITRSNGKIGIGEMTVVETEWEGELAFLISIRDITDHKQLEEALRKSKEKFRDLANLLPQTVFEIDLAGNFTFVNQHAIEATGYSLEDIEKKRLNAINLFIPEDRERIMENLMKRFSGEDFNDHEYTLLRKDGKTYPVLIYSSPIIHNDIPEGLRGIVLDITDRKQMEEALRESEEKFRLLFENAQEGILTLDKEGIIIDVNPRVLEIIECTREDVIGKNLIDLLPIFNLDPKEVIKTFKELASGESVNMCDWEITTKKGRKITIAVKLALIEKDDNLFVASVTIDDISKRKIAENALKESEDKYRDLFENANDLIQSVNYDGKFDYVNKIWIDTLGYTENELKELSLKDILRPDKLPHCQEIFEKVCAGKPINKVETVFIAKDGREIHVEGAVNARFKEGKFIATRGIFRDITDRKMAEEKLNRTLMELERSNKELETFAYVASHDLQEPLRMIASYLQLLEHRYRDRLDRDANDFINFAVDGAKRMQNLINDLLLYSRVGTRGKKFEITNSDEILNQALSDLKLLIDDSGAKITYDPLPKVNADNVQVGQLFQNLIGNAIKFHNEEPPKVHITAENLEKDWLFSIADNGIGIDPKYSDRAFMIFQRLHNKNDYPGTGIGLAICKRIVERHKGKIWLKSKPGEGTTFYFTIPKTGSDE